MSEGRFSTEVFAHLDVARDGIDAVSSELTASDAFPRLLADWFCILWDVIRATTPVLGHCQRRLDTMPQDDEFNGVLRDFYLLKLTEEHDHDQMLVGDLGRLGVAREQLQQRIPPAPIAAMVGSQYYYIDYVHPAAYLGYVGLLEAYPAKLDQLENLIERSGAPPEAWSTYRMHAEVDAWHREELAEILDRVPPDPTIRKSILSNGLRTGEFYCQALEQLLARARESSAAA
jgi:hypothetical protein